tara:strand:+ start:678 stop:1952 length:1275 start_codon:yes stop_codon:yes gene_type:complete
MTYVGQQPSTTFDSGIQDRFTGLSSNTVTLTHDISAETDILVVWNNIVQDSGTYSVGGTGNKTLTLGGTLVSADVVTVYYTNKVMQSINPTAGSVGIAELNVSDGSNGHALTTNGSGTLSFADVGADADNYFQSGLSSKDLGNGLHVKIADSGGSVNANRGAIVVEGTGDHGMTIVGNNAGQGGLWFANQSATDAGQIDYNHPDDTMRFYTAGGERMRIGDTGKVFIQCTQAPSSSVSGIQLADSNSASKFGGGSGTTNQNLIVFYNGNGEVGKIHTSGSNTTYATSSDYRLKENVNYNWDATTRLKQLKPARFNFKADADTTVDGFLAHEVSSIVPQAVVGTKDATESKTNVVLNPVGDIAAEGITEEEWTQGKADGIYLANSTWHSSKDVPVYQSIDQSKLVPLLIKTIQELEARVKTLEDA